MVQAKKRQVGRARTGGLANRFRQAAVLVAWIAALGTSVGYFFPGATAAAKTAVAEGGLSLRQAWTRLEGADLERPQSTSLAGSVVVISTTQ